MTVGFQVFSEDQKLIYDSSHATWTLVEIFLYLANSTVSRKYPFLRNQYHTLRAGVMFTNTHSMDSKSIAPTVNTGWAELNVSGGNRDTYIAVLMQ